MRKPVASYITLHTVFEDGTSMEETLSLDEMDVRMHRRVDRRCDGTLDADPFYHLSISGFARIKNTKN